MSHSYFIAIKARCVRFLGRLVGGLDPFETYLSKWAHLPQFSGWKSEIFNIWNHHLDTHFMSVEHPNHPGTFWCQETRKRSWAPYETPPLEGTPQLLALDFEKSGWNHLEPQTTIYKWMFGETTIFYIKIWNHPIETTIYKWLFGVPGSWVGSRSDWNVLDFSVLLPNCSWWSFWEDDLEINFYREPTKNPGPFVSKGYLNNQGLALPCQRVFCFAPVFFQDS